VLAPIDVGGERLWFAEAGGVVCDLHDVGWWTRTETRTGMRVSVALGSSVTPARWDAVTHEADRLAASRGRALELIRVS
jgi:hypothetical protein